MERKVWFCKIGALYAGTLPSGSDAPMRAAVERAFKTLTGVDAEFVFSGWGQKLNEPELATVEDREPIGSPVDALLLRMVHDANCAYTGAFTTGLVSSVCECSARSLIGDYASWVS